MILLTCLLIVPVLLLTVACGGDDEETPEPGPETTITTGGPAPTTAAATTEEEPTEPEDTPVPASSDDPFVIGVMESVTGPGETYGNVAVQAKQMAVDEINAAGGINGRELRLIVEDS